MKTGTLRVILLVIIAALSGYFYGTHKITIAWQNYKPHLAVLSKEPPPSVMPVDFSPMWIVLQKLESKYYDKTAIDSQKILNGAISGMVESLEDPYTVYLPPKQNTDFKQALAGNFEGIGAELGMKGKQLIVVAPLDGSPAQKAGIKAGDAIMRVDGQMTFGWTINQAVDKIRGSKGTTVTISVIHKDETRVQDVKIARDTIHVKSVTLWIKKVKDIPEIDQKTFSKTAQNTKVAYLRLSQFGDATNQEWVSFINQVDLARKKDETIKGMVLDLRNNPGGYLTDAVFIASEFLSKGVIVIQDDGLNQAQSLSVSRPGLLIDFPLVILINKGSASASEIVSGALRDHNRAKLVGETSFGKGTIQMAEDLGKGAGLHITVAKWLTPNGTWIHQKGLTPDIAVELDAKDPARDTQLEKAISLLIK